MKLRISENKEIEFNFAYDIAYEIYIQDDPLFDKIISNQNLIDFSQNKKIERVPNPKKALLKIRGYSISNSIKTIHNFSYTKIRFKELKNTSYANINLLKL